MFLLWLLQSIPAVLLCVLDEWEDTGDKMRTELKDSCLQASLALIRITHFHQVLQFSADHLLNFMFFHGGFVDPDCSIFSNTYLQEHLGYLTA